MYLFHQCLEAGTDDFAVQNKTTLKVVDVSKEAVRNVAKVFQYLAVAAVLCNSSGFDINNG